MQHLVEGLLAIADSSGHNLCPAAWPTVILQALSPATYLAPSHEVLSATGYMARMQFRLLSQALQHPAGFSGNGLLTIIGSQIAPVTALPIAPMRAPAIGKPGTPPPTMLVFEYDDVAGGDDDGMLVNEYDDVAGGE